VHRDVVAAEFRKSIYASPNISLRSLQGKVLQSLADHLRGFARSSAVQTGLRRLSMPITFLRTEDRPAGELGAPTLLHELAPLWALAASLVEVRELSPEAKRYICSVDVVGNEDALPNWAFV